MAWGGDQVGELGDIGGVGGMGEGRGETEICIWLTAVFSSARSGLAAPKEVQNLHETFVVCLSQGRFIAERDWAQLQLSRLGCSRCWSRVPAHAMHLPKYTPAPRMHPGACSPMSINARH